MVVKHIREFIALEFSSAYFLLGATILALLMSNSPLSAYYAQVFQHRLSLFVNEGLMAIFFLVVGLEIKYEFLQGALNTRAKACLPGIAALGGMVIPAFLYTLFNWSQAAALRGWAIPTATDIAFALGVLSFIGRGVPSGLKAFLMALAIFDDLAAIVIIAFFYTHHLSFVFLGWSLLCIGGLFFLNKMANKQIVWYSLLGIGLWVTLLKAGISPTVAGVLLALFIPLDLNESLQQRLHPFSAFIILPLFALTNAGVSLLHVPLTDLQFPIYFGIFVSLFLGKQMGVFGACWLAVKCKIAHLPESVTWRLLYGASILCGIGFTISLLIGELAFMSMGEYYTASIKIGVLSGSLVSGVVGYWVLKRASHVSTI